MIHIQELLERNNQTSKERNELLKKHFELYTDTIDVTGREVDCFSILANLTSKDSVELDNVQHSKVVLKDNFFWVQFRKVASQLHTHNLKWPDPRVSLKHQIRIISEPPSLPKFGWSGNSSDYRIGRMLTSTFVWQGDEHSIISVWLGDYPEWRKAAYKLGLNKAFWQQVKQDLKNLFSASHLPDSVDSYSPELLYPYKDHYLTITPVVSHEKQLRIQKISDLPWHSLSFAHPSSIGVLCGSLGGHIRLLKFQPLIAQHNINHAVYGLRGYLDPHLIVNKDAQRIYQETVDVKTYSSLRLKRQARLESLHSLDEIIERWCTPFIQLKLTSQKLPSPNELSLEEYAFLQAETPDIDSFSRYLNRKLHSALEQNKYCRYFSYHQRLIGVTQNRIKALLTRLFSPAPSDELCDGLYLVFDNLRINEANGLNNPYVVGMPSMIGLYGFLHLFERELQESYPNISLDSFALHCSQYQVDAGIHLPAPSVPRKEMQVKRSGLMPKFKFDGKFSIVAKLKGSFDTSDALDIELIKQAMPERLWGGSVHAPFLYEDTEWVHSVCGLTELKQHLIKKQYFGSWLCPANTPHSNLEEAISLLKQRRDLSLCLVGFELLESVKPRTTESGIHAFCESLISTCHLKPTFKVIRNLAKIEQEIFWRYMPASQSCTTLKVGSVCGETTNAASQSTQL